MKNIIHIFDCDGVLLDSNSAKIDAIREALELVGCPVRFIRWAEVEFRKNFGRTRQQHFDAFKSQLEISEIHLDPCIMDEAIVIYSNRVISLYFDCDVIQETLSYIMINIDEDSSNLFVVSASDEIELRDILPTKIPQIKRENIFGGPISKIDNLEKVKKINGGGDSVFYGDAVQDAKAAVFAGVKFLGLTKYSADSDALITHCTQNNLRFLNNLSMVNL